jgi:hypothetical protein
MIMLMMMMIKLQSLQGNELITLHTVITQRPSTETQWPSKPAKLYMNVYFKNQENRKVLSQNLTTKFKNTNKALTET